MRIFILILAWIMAFPPALMAEVFFYHTDNVGTPVAMTDRTGAVVWRANDLPFGEQHTTQGTGQNNRRLAGKEMDETTGLVSMGVRYMDPETGMFLQPDPVGPVDVASGKINAALLTSPERLNRYAYALNNPYKYVDPDGEVAMLVAALLVAGAALLTTPQEMEAPDNTMEVVLTAATYAEGGFLLRGMSKGVVRKSIASKSASKIVNTTGKQLQKKFKHAKDFGVTGNFSPANAKKFNSAINQDLNAPGTKEILGTFK